MIVYVHGGGWISGHARTAEPSRLATGSRFAFKPRGYVVASVRQLSIERGSPFARGRDVASAVRWLRTQASRYSIDKNRIVWGVGRRPARRPRYGL